MIIIIYLVYILEDGVVKEQNVAGNYNQNFIHNNVLRKEASDNINVFGSSLNFDVNGNDLTSFYDVPLDSTGGGIIAIYMLSLLPGKKMHLTTDL